MANYTPNYNLVIPQPGDNVLADIILIGNSNTIIDTQIKSLHDQDIVLQSEITNNYTTLDIKIDTQDNIINNRIDNLVLHAAPLPEVAAQEVYDSRFSSVYNITFTVLTDRITNVEQNVVDLTDYVDTTISDALLAMQAQIDDLKTLIFCGGIG